MKKNKVIVLISVTIVFLFAGCSTIKNTLNAISQFENIQFKLGKADNFSVNSVNISKINKVSDISVTDALLLTKAVTSKSLPVNFTLNLLAVNPNKKGTNTIKDLNAVISRLDWELFIDDKQTINGAVTSPITLPAENQTTAIPVGIGLDLMKFFSDKGYNDIINLVLAIGGQNASSSRLKLKVKPTVNIAGIPINYPNYITVIDKEFRGK